MKAILLIGIFLATYVLIQLLAAAVGKRSGVFINIISSVATTCIASYFLFQE